MSLLAAILPVGIALTADVADIELPSDLTCRISQLEEIVGETVVVPLAAL